MHDDTRSHEEARREKPYADDLAYIHDVGFGAFATEAAPGFLHLLREHGVHEGRVVDLGCGSGLFAREMVRAGYEVLGIDLSSSMIEIARQRVPVSTFVVASILDADLPACDAVTAMGECFNYLFDRRLDEHASAGVLLQLFRRIYRALHPGGALIFDVAGPGRGAGRTMSHHEGDDWAILVRYDEDAANALLTRYITTFREGADGCYRRHHETHRLRLYERSDILTWLREAGFEARVLDPYGTHTLPDAWTGFLARKPSQRGDEAEEIE